MPKGLQMTTTWRSLLNKFVEALEDEPKELNMVTWRKLLEFTKLLNESDLKKEILNWQKIMRIKPIRLP